MFMIGDKRLLFIMDHHHLLPAIHHLFSVRIDNSRAAVKGGCPLHALLNHHSNGSLWATYGIALCRAWMAARRTVLPEHVRIAHEQVKELSGIDAVAYRNWREKLSAQCMNFTHWSAVWRRFPLLLFYPDSPSGANAMQCLGNFIIITLNGIQNWKVPARLPSEVVCQVILELWLLTIGDCTCSSIMLKKGANACF
jgi:hypothetical protein